MAATQKPMIGVTGATGFIGQRLIRKLFKEGYSIKAFVLEQESFLPKKVLVVKGNLVTGSGIKKFLEGVDILVHLAARLLPPEEKMHEDNFIATKNLMEIAEKFPIKKTIFMSSAAVYGDKKGKIVTETINCKPNIEYGRTKRLAEKFILNWEKGNKRTAFIFRPFNIYGPGNYKGVIYNFYKNIRKDGRVTIYGTGDQTRNFLFIDDVVSAILLGIKEKKGGIFNLASPENYSVKKILVLFEKIFNKNIVPKFEYEEKGKVVELNLSAEKAKKILGWRAKVGLEKGLRKTIVWYDANL